jgi:hypothetical protein
MMVREIASVATLPRNDKLLEKETRLFSTIQTLSEPRKPRAA